MENITVSEHRKQYQKEWHQRNKKRRLKAARERRTELQLWFKDYKSQLKCEKCGFSHPAAIDFHHLDGDSKVGEISKLMTAKLCKETILAEIAKCQVLCANCHRILHDKGT